LSTPIGYSGSSAIAMCRARTNEYTAQTDASVLTFLNAAVEQIEGELGCIRLYGIYVATPGQQIFTLTEDTQDVFSMSFSTGPLTPAPSTAIVYPMWQLEPQSFMQTAAGFPGVGAGPPSWWMAFTDESSVINIQVYPPCFDGQLNVYYRGRPQLWADTTVNSSTNLDTLSQEACILWTCCRMLEAVQRGDESKDIFQPQLDARIDKLKDSMARRATPKQGRVTDVASYSYPTSTPWWLGGR
jgi:hypothetical protein